MHTAFRGPARGHGDLIILEIDLGNSCDIGVRCVRYIEISDDLWVGWGLSIRR